LNDVSCFSGANVRFLAENSKEAGNKIASEGYLSNFHFSFLQKGLPRSNFLVYFAL